MKKKSKNLLVIALTATTLLGFSTHSFASEDITQDDVVCSESEGTIGRTRLSYGKMTVYGTTSTGEAYAIMKTYSGNADTITAKVSTKTNSMEGPSSSVTTGKNTSSARSNTVVCGPGYLRRATGSGKIVYKGDTQTASPTVYY